MQQPTPKRQLAELLLNEPLDRFVRTRRAAGHAWRQIAIELRDATDGRVDVTGESLRSWFPDQKPEKASA